MLQFALMVGEDPQDTEMLRDVLKPEDGTFYRLRITKLH